MNVLLLLFTRAQAITKPLLLIASLLLGELIMES